MSGNQFPLGKRSLTPYLRNELRKFFFVEFYWDVLNDIENQLYGDLSYPHKIALHSSLKENKRKFK